MGQGHSTVNAYGDSGYVATSQIVRSKPADLLRMIIPSKLVRRYKISLGQVVAISDCLGCQWYTTVQQCCYVIFLGCGWASFAKSAGAKAGDLFLFKIKAPRAVKVTIFCGGGVQKFPTVLDQARVHDIPSRDFSSFGCCNLAGIVDNGSGKPVDAAMHSFIEGVCDSLKPRRPVYLTRITINQDDEDSATFDRAYTREYIEPLLDACVQTVHLVCGSDEPTHALLTISCDDERAVIFEGWEAFANRYMIEDGCNYIFHFDKFMGSITIAIYVM